MEEKKDIRALSKEAISEFFVAQGDKAFRGKQVYEWLWKKNAYSFDEMTNISKASIAILKAHFVINHINVDTVQKSKDGTIKNGVKLHDGLVVESVMIPTPTRTTACISSQVGCSLACTFCATALLKRQRNLTASEIYDQVAAINKESLLYHGHKLSNIVYMGMGEPLLNYANVMESIKMITSDEGLGMSPRRITLSTVGLPKMIKRMADEDVRFNLAVSLHSAIDETRSKMMPINDTSNLEELMDSLQYWHAKTGNRITFEYVIWKGINDSRKDVEALVKYCKRVPVKVNLIEYNAIDSNDFKQADKQATDMYLQVLEKNNIIVNIRRSRGRDIDAACGQLANKEIKE
jgi:23S rRNA (adenine2503-C2)-methyltransferase